jgi:hypothetical protein
MITQFNDIMNKDGFYASGFLPGANASAATNYGVIFIALVKCELVAVKVSWETGGSVDSTLQIEKLTGTTVPGSGTNLLAAALATTTVANTVASPALTTTKDNRVFSPGDRLALKDGGTLTNLAGLAVTCVFHPIGKGHYQTL